MFLKQLKYIRSSLSVIGSLIIGCPSFLRALYQLLRRREIVKNAAILVAFEEGGFGHTIAAPDIARRLYPAKSIVFVIVSTSGRHNLASGLLWPESLKLIFFEIHSRSPWPILSTAVIRLFCGWTKRPGTIYFRSILDLYSALNLRSPSNARSFNTNLNIQWIVNYFELIRSTVDVLPLSIPAEIVGKSRCALNIPDKAKIASIYLRHKSGGDSTNSTRCGSDFFDYVPSINYLISQGYAVLVVGDVDVPNEYCQGALPVVGRVSAQSAGIQPEIFYLFSISAASVCISECGGGGWLPTAMNKPHLCTNAFPYFFAMKNAWMLPKRIRSEDGVLIEPRQLFTDYLYNYEVAPGYKLESNSRDDLLSATIDFITDVEKGMMPTLPDIDFSLQGTLYTAAGAGICRAWAKNFANGFVGTEK